MNKREFKRIEKPFMARLRIKQCEGLEISSAEWDIIALKAYLLEVKLMKV